MVENWRRDGCNHTKTDEMVMCAAPRIHWIDKELFEVYICCISNR